MSRVELASGQLRIDGVPRVLLSASLFPFRVPSELWADRLAAVKRLGYHAIDVYVPWNYHETEPGQWDFSGDRDIGEFLDLARQARLLVVARPGPYICSEWDGGGLPAWLTLTENLRLRQNEPLYLAQVERWFSRIMPVLARQQYDQGGPVILVQLENELDFFDCEDPAGYLSALVDSARRHGVTIPLIACAGQGDIARGTGGLPTIHPAVNLYPSDDSPDIERQTAYFAAALAQQGQPLLVTETNRFHRTLKRLLAGGARLLGPYLQASGWNSEYGTAVNNWGAILGLMTHDYDFGGVIDPVGHERADAAEGRRLAKVIDALGTRLAAATPSAELMTLPGLDTPCAVCDLDQGGQLFSVTNLDHRPTKTTLTEQGVSIDVTVPALSTLALVRSLALPTIAAHIVLAGAELTGLTETPEAVAVDFATHFPIEILVRILGQTVVRCTGDIRHVAGNKNIRLCGTIGTAVITSAAGALTVHLEPAEIAPALAVGDPISAITKVKTAVSCRQPWKDVETDTQARALERFGVYRGNGRYLADGLPPGTQGIVLRQAADVIEVRVGSHLLDWTANGGTDLWSPLARPTDNREILDVRARIWGHSNFDDGRLSSLRLGSLRGITGALAVTRQENISPGWFAHSVNGRPVGQTPAPPSGLGGRMTALFPQTVRYTRNIDLSQSGAAALTSQGNQARLLCFVNGEHRGAITPLSPTLWLGDLREGDDLAIEVTRNWGEPTGDLTLLTGTALTNWTVQRQSTTELAHSLRAAKCSATTLPLDILPDEPRWIDLDSQHFSQTTESNAVVRLFGRGTHVTALASGRNLGRIWLGGVAGATLKGGRGDILLIPRSLLDDGLQLYAEATKAEGGHIEAITVGGPLD